jgi:hypothetical protein
VPLFHAGFCVATRQLWCFARCQQCHARSAYMSEAILML